MKDENISAFDNFDRLEILCGHTIEDSPYIVPDTDKQTSMFGIEMYTIKTVLKNKNNKIIITYESGETNVHLCRYVEGWDTEKDYFIHEDELNNILFKAVNEYLDKLKNE